VEIRTDGILERRYTDLEIQTSNNIDFSRYENEIKLLNLKGFL
jgi:hypothetical protein